LHEYGVIKEIIISDVDPNETDDELWTWALEHALLPAGINVTPWMRHTLTRRGTEAAIQLEIPFDNHQPAPLAN